MEEKRNYQLTFLASGNLSEKERENLIENIKKLFSKKGEVLKIEKAKKINLSYPIKKEKEAFLGTIVFKCLPQDLEGLKNDLAKEKELLRYLLIKKQEKERVKGKEKLQEKKVSVPEKKVELKKIEEKLEEIL